MARPIRIDFPGAWHDVTARGNERRAVYRDDTDRRRFAGLLPELETRFGLEIQGYGLMADDDHLIVETGDARMSAAMQWLNVSCTAWFNRHWRTDGESFPRALQGAPATPDGGGQGADETRRTSRANVE